MFIVIQKPNSNKVFLSYLILWVAKKFTTPDKIVVSGFDLMFRHTLELSPLESENKKKN